jgi:hypothetical protein|tara:strand:- start:721 stop:990 length:270 start_codon:yes stop_codon:yes gene_type:complete
MTTIEITDIDIDTKVTFKHGDNLEFENDGVVYHIEEDCDWVEGDRVMHVRCDELDEVFEVINPEIVEAWEEESNEKTFFGPFSFTKQAW